MKKLNITVVLAMIAMLSLTFTSCSKDDDNDPAYVGTWVNQETEDFFGEELTIKTTLILTASNFEMEASTVILGITLPMFGMKGGLSVSGDSFTITPTSIAMANDEGVLVWINKGDDGWDDALDEVELSESETVTYSISGNQMSITFEGDTEAQVFTKQ